MKLLAISDIHVEHKANRERLQQIEGHEADWLLLAGDVADSLAHFVWALKALTSRFARVIWVPGNHELWRVPTDPHDVEGETRYQYLVEICRQLGVITPEDPFPEWNGEGGAHVIAPLFCLYDYSFRPDDVPEDRAVAWAEESGIRCTDEDYMKPSPHASIPDWCRERVRRSLERLAALPADRPAVLVNHFPLREELVTLRYPRFAIWCGTRATGDWHRRFRACTVVSGHLHIPSSRVIEGVRFEEVSMGYPREWQARAASRPLLREILSGGPKGHACGVPAATST